MLVVRLRRQGNMAKSNKSFWQLLLTHQGQFEPEELAQMPLARPARPLPLSLPPHPACAWCLQAAARCVDELMLVRTTHGAIIGARPSNSQSNPT